MTAKGKALSAATVFTAGPIPAVGRVSRWRQRRRSLEPWLLGVAGFTATVAAQLLLKHEGPIGPDITAVAEQISGIMTT